MRASFRLVYSFGSEYVPTHREGRVVLTLHGDGRATLDNVQAGAFTASWQGRIERATLERIVGHLAAAGFPAVSRHPIPPGATLRQVVIQSGSAAAHNPPLDWWAAREMPGYAEAFAILDSLVAELGGGRLSMVVVSEPGLIRPADPPLRSAIALEEAWLLGLAPELFGMAMVEDHRRTVERLLGKLGRSAPVAPAGMAEVDAWIQEVHGTAEELVSGAAAEAFALGRAVGQIRRGLEQDGERRMDAALGLLDLSRHLPARDIAELAASPPADPKQRLQQLSSALLDGLRRTLTEGGKAWEL